jgi:hypothetical protein
MENPTPFDLNEAIRRWQQNLGASPAFKADNLEELASHLRASVQKLKATGISEEEAFQIAVRRIGDRGLLEREFHKVNPVATWSLPKFLFWIATGVFLARVILSLWEAVRSAEWSYNFAPHRLYNPYPVSNLVGIALLCFAWSCFSWAGGSSRAVGRNLARLSSRVLRAAPTSGSNSPF